MNALDVAVLDIDGTLLDSNYHHAIAWSRAFREHAVPVPVWRVHRALGMGGDRLVAAVAGDEVEAQVGDSVREQWEHEYDAIIGETGLFTGAGRLLQGLRDRGLRVVLASSAIPRHAQHALDLLEAEEVADAWTTAEDAEESKPAPDLLDEAVARVGGGPAVMIGDAVWDVRSAAARHIPTIGLRCGGTGPDELLRAGAVAIFDDPADLCSRLDEALRRAVSGMADRVPGTPG
ncbi:HAD family hydrolase [Nocardioides taihuensis]|uniref:HAD family hydrolase n=1 Tax=Nocardioides taihuensis TaxID=1835606 RepID=A0ABW0BG46_9ACTN